MTNRQLTALILAMFAALMLSACGPRYLQKATIEHDTIRVAGFDISAHKPAREIDQDMIDSLMSDCDDLRRALEYDLAQANDSLDEYRNKPPVRGQDLIESKNTTQNTSEVKKVAQRLRNTACPPDSLLREFTQIIATADSEERRTITVMARHDSSGLSLRLVSDSTKFAYEKETNTFEPVKRGLPWWLWTAFGVGLAFAFFVGYKTGK